MTPFRNKKESNIFANDDSAKKLMRVEPSDQKDSTESLNPFKLTAKSTVVTEFSKGAT